MRRRLNIGWQSTNSETDEHQDQNLQFANDFTSMNNIYELQSAINKLSIQKQKNYIAYTIAIKEQQEIVDGYEQIVSQLRNKIDETERELRSEKSRADFSEAQIKSIESKRKNLEDKFGQIAETIDGSISYNLIISNYNQARTQVIQQAQQIKNLNSQIEQLSQKNQNLAMQLDCTKKCMESQLKQISQRLENQANSFNEKFSNLALESNSQMLKKAERERKLQQSVTQLQEQNKNLLWKIASYRSQLQQLKNVHIQNQILKLQNQSKAELGYRDKYKEIKQKLENLLQQKNKLIEELKIKQKQNLILVQSNEKNVQQYANLQRQVRLTKQINQKIQQKMGEFDMQGESKKREPSDKLARLDELAATFKIQREKLQGQLNIQKRTILHLEKKVEEKQEQIRHLEISNQKSQDLIMILQRSNENSKNSIVNLQKQNSSMKIKLVQIEQKLSRKQTQLLIHLKQNSYQIPKSNEIKINVQKYESLMLSLTSLGKEKSIADKQLLRIKNQLKFTQFALQQKVRKNNEYEHQIGRFQTKIRTLQAEINQGTEKIKRLQQQIEEKRVSKEKDYKQFVEKTELMSQCIDQLKKWRTQYEKKQVKKNCFKLIKQAVRIKIGHQQMVKTKQLGDRKQKEREGESKGKIKGKEDYCSTNCQVILVRPRIKSQMIKGNKEIINGENKNSEDQKLDRTIKQLKKQKQSLVSNKII